jgi:hypothetical protein
MRNKSADDKALVKCHSEIREQQSMKTTDLSANLNLTPALQELKPERLALVFARGDPAETSDGLTRDVAG